MSRRTELGVGCLLLGAMVVTGVMVFFIGGTRSWGTFEVTVPVRDAGGLQAGAVVKSVGVEVGTVHRLELDGQHAVVSLRLDPSAGLRADVIPRVRPASLLGEWYVELVPGTPDAALLKGGDALREVGPQVEIDELVNALGPLLGAVDPEALGAATARLREALDEDPERLSRMLDDLETMLDHGAEASAELPVMVADVKRAMAAMQGAAARIDARAREAEALIVRGDAVLADLEAASEPLPQTIAEARQTLQDARDLLAALDASTAELDQALAGLGELDSAEIERILRDVGIRVRLAKRKKSE